MKHHLTCRKSELIDVPTYKAIIIYYTYYILKPITYHYIFYIGRTSIFPRLLKEANSKPFFTYNIPIRTFWEENCKTNKLFLSKKQLNNVINYIIKPLYQVELVEVYNRI